MAWLGIGCHCRIIHIYLYLFVIADIERRSSSIRISLAISLSLHLYLYVFFSCLSISIHLSLVKKIVKKKMKKIVLIKNDEYLSPSTYNACVYLSVIQIKSLPHGNVSKCVTYITRQFDTCQINTHEMNITSIRQTEIYKHTVFETAR